MVGRIYRNASADNFVAHHWAWEVVQKNGKIKKMGCCRMKFCNSPSLLIRSDLLLYFPVYIIFLGQAIGGAFGGLRITGERYKVGKAIMSLTFTHRV